MPNASFRDLCLDAPLNSAEELSRFWADVLGTVSTEATRGYRVEARPGEPRASQIWVNPVPEPRAGKTRVHLDLRLPEPDPSPLVALGARIVTEPGTDPWWVLADPDGNLFCAFPPGETPPARTTPFELVVDCSDALAQATWWAAQVGGTVHEAESKGYAWIEGAAGFPWNDWVFDPVPEPKTVKNRLHWDVDLAGADPGPLIDAGATLLRRPDTDIFWWVLADPEGNEFDAFGSETR
ncbi:VOC family protein [Cryptosporangium sp. NPDC051539]|uniref:VOC family protein n=1 Tax=Cryptosporangium sp. NPDC051539 TaxID=3363962 RepID=UPI0037B1D4AC